MMAISFGWQFMAAVAAVAVLDVAVVAAALNYVTPISVTTTPLPQF